MSRDCEKRDLNSNAFVSFTRFILSIIFMYLNNERNGMPQLKELKWQTATETKND